MCAGGCGVAQVKVTSITAFPFARLATPTVRSKGSANTAEPIESTQSVGPSVRPISNDTVTDNVLVTASIREAISSIAPDMYTFEPFTSEDDSSQTTTHYSVSFAALTAQERKDSLFPLFENSQAADTQAATINYETESAPDQGGLPPPIRWKGKKIRMKRTRDPQEMDLINVYDAEDKNDTCIESLLLENRPRKDIFAEANRRFQQPGCVLIMKFDIDCEDPVVKLSANMYLRSALECAVRKPLIISPRPLLKKWRKNRDLRCVLLPASLGAGGSQPNHVSNPGSVI